MSIDWIARARSEVQGMHPYQAGKPLKEAQRELGVDKLVKLASNENPHGPSQKVLAAIREEALDCNRYPDSNGYYLKQMLAAQHGVEPAAITLGNGSNDVLELVASAYLDHRYSAVYSEYAFVVYQLAVQRSGARAKVAAARDYAHDLEAMLNCVDADTRVVFIANPNNPTGGYLAEKDLLAFLAALDPGIVVVLDEAYYEYVAAQDYPSGVALQSQFSNLVVTRTFSKAHGLSGLRIGYAVSHPDIADALNRVRAPFNVSSLALAAAQAALADEAHIVQAVNTNDAGMQQLTDGLEALGFWHIPSVANFISFQAGGTGQHKHGAAALNQALLSEGVIIRPLANYAMPDHLRVSIGLPEENAFFLDKLAKLNSA
ncbi:MAG: histidinol-phosphate transaminase [Gammaproteobacteria bacterium]|nr:histidinol-phosphate transaminase [Gammaproteobacteria bacterium]MBT8149963.1 histidinol-phosphate transaminase [Gammaproteobacteria bacterium]NND40127.1 histidinol-phosphate transaminase [Pseudomonadales bacterium]RZV57311.1 MAG: histidinol-phosphate transaminase [Pseudomonadales bacterium]